MTRAAEALRQTLDQIALDTGDLESALRRLFTARQRVEGALLALGEDPDQPSDAELEEFRPAEVEVTEEPRAARAPIVVTGNTQRGFPCPICGAVFETENGMRGHRGQKHRDEIPPVLADIPPKAPAARVDYDRVAAVLAEIQQRPDVPSVYKALADHFDVPLTTAKNWINTIRKRAERAPAPAPLAVAPAAAPKQPASRREELVLACSECRSEFAPTQFADMIRHCRLEHSRRPTDAERSPVNTLRGAA